jgi:tellurite resistance protein TerC
VHVTFWVWFLTIAIALAFLAADIFVLGRRPHEPSLTECAIGLGCYVAAALAFGAGVFLVSGSRYGIEFYAGWLTEYSLSVDNLFVFLIIMARLAVPRQLQQSALLIGIVLALLLRGVFIGVGASLINAFSPVFYLFGAFLLYTAMKLAREPVAGRPSGTQAGEEPAAGVPAGQPGAENGQGEPGAVRWLRRRVPISDSYSGNRLLVRSGGARLLTPMAIVIISLGTTDLLFALDSIPAIYGLTREPYLVLTANLFALMGLRQLYFLIGGGLRRLVYLNHGLAVLLGFIGVKLVLHALHENTLPFLNGGRPVGWAPDVPIWLSLAIIVGVLAVTTVASLARVPQPARR